MGFISLLMLVVFGVALLVVAVCFIGFVVHEIDKGGAAHNLARMRGHELRE